MATAVAKSSYGAAGRETLVRGPLLIRPTFPRFLAPGDLAEVPVVVFNLTNAAGLVKVKLEAKGCAGVEGTAARSVRIAADGEAVVSFRLRATSACGEAEFTVCARLGDFTAESNIALPVRPAAPAVTLCEAGWVAAGESKTFDLGGQWLPGTLEQKLICSAMPTLDLGPGLSYLLRYPYGCVEQTSSRCFPLIYLRELAETVEPDLVGDEVEDFVDAGITRLWSMQTNSGALSMWSGGREPYWWGSTYAAHFIVEAKRAGFEVEKEDLDLLLDALEKRLDKTGSDEGNRSVNAYICYVLSIAGRGECSWVERLAEEAEDMSAQAKYHIAAAAFRLGKRGLSRKLIGMDVVLPKTTALSGSLSSRARDAAVLLDVLLEIDPDSASIPNLMRIILERRRGGRWCSTQENSFALLALGKYAKRFGSEKPDFTAVVSGAGEKLSTFTHEKPATVQLMENASAKLEVSGEGRCFYTLFRRGTPPDGNVEESDNGLIVRRHLYDRDGKALAHDKIRRGQTVVVEINIHADRFVPNVVVTDMLPAGLEIENPRIASRDRTGWLAKGNLNPEHIDMRDDRLIIFTEARKKTGTYRYVARAVACGEFSLPPIAAECMYDGSIASVNGKGKIRVVK
jgi:uncharacterized protein YfaS (alpha-2-macroglobulin family)